MLEKMTWKEFQDSGLLWWINTILHTIGVCICVEVDDNGNITNTYPAKTKFRGFSEKSNTKGYSNISKYIRNNIDDIVKDAE